MCDHDVVQQPDHPLQVFPAALALPHALSAARQRRQARSAAAADEIWRGDLEGGRQGAVERALVCLIEEDWLTKGKVLIRKKISALNEHGLEALARRTWHLDLLLTD